MNTPSNLQAAIDAAKAAKAGQSETAAVQKTGKSYQFPSAPTNFIMPNGRRVIVPDGVYTTEDAEELRELEAMVTAGTIWRAADVQPGEITPQMQTPDPVDPHKVN